jgi:hypothetical protein
VWTSQMFIIEFESLYVGKSSFEVYSDFWADMHKIVLCELPILTYSLFWISTWCTN